MGDYKRDRWASMVEEAREDLAGTCPLVEDEAILWAHDRITALEAALREISDSDPDESAGRLRDIANDALEGTCNE